MRKLMSLILVLALTIGLGCACAEQDNFLVSDWKLLYALATLLLLNRRFSSMKTTPLK